FELAGALAAGAILRLAPREDLLPRPPLAALATEAGITTGVLPPSALGILPPADLPTMRKPFMGGESCPPERADAWAADRRLVNVYGPTETTVIVTQGEHR